MGAQTQYQLKRRVCVCVCRAGVSEASNTIKHHEMNHKTNAWTGVELIQSNDLAAVVARLFANSVIRFENGCGCGFSVHACEPIGAIWMSYDCGDIIMLFLHPFYLYSYIAIHCARAPLIAWRCSPFSCIKNHVHHFINFQNRISLWLLLLFIVTQWLPYA